MNNYLLDLVEPILQSLDRSIEYKYFEGTPNDVFLVMDVAAFSRDIPKTEKLYESYLYSLDLFASNLDFYKSDHQEIFKNSTLFRAYWEKLNNEF
jgi:hypothetical protein